MISVEQVTENISMLIADECGNTVVFTGEDGVLVVDTKVTPLIGHLQAAIAKISDKPIRFLINTHWHPDHVGGNKEIGEAGAVIIAHENARKRMSTEQYIEFLFDATIPPSPPIALPVVTFTREMTLHFNGEEIFIFYVQDGHTDDDIAIYFRKANVIHMGDIFDEGIYPYIGVSSGGSVNGMIAVATHILAMIDDSTKVIPGHGPLSNKQGLQRYIDMLTIMRDRILEQITAGKTLEEIVASKPSQEFDAQLGQSLLQPDNFVTMLYKDLSRTQT